MIEKNYGFSSVEIDESITLDTWKPAEKPKNKLIKSQWRKNQIQDNYNQEPGLDDLRKIKSAVKKGVNDHEIMETYGINAETIVAIKQDIYNPAKPTRYFQIEDLDLKDGTVMFLEFQKIQHEFYGMVQAMHFLNDILFSSKKDKKNFTDIFQGKKPYKVLFKKNEEQFDDENDDY